MAFFDTEAYKLHLRRRVADSTTLVFALSFDTSGSFLAAGTVNGLLKIFSLSAIALSCYGPPPQSHLCAVRDLSRHGSINGLAVTEQELYVATDNGLLCFTWKQLIAPISGGQPALHIAPNVILPGTQFNAVIKLGQKKRTSSVVAATSTGAFVLVSDGGKKFHQIGDSIGEEAYPHCVTGDTDSNIFLAVSSLTS